MPGRSLCRTRSNGCGRDMLRRRANRVTMNHFIRLVAVVSSDATIGSRARGDDALETLWKDYQAYGLPVPPKHAELAHLPGPGVRHHDGVREQDIYLVLLVMKPQGKERAAYWIGCEAGPQWHSIEFKPVPP